MEDAHGHAGLQGQVGDDGLVDGGAVEDDADHGHAGVDVRLLGVVAHIAEQAATGLGAGVGEHIVDAALLGHGAAVEDGHMGADLTDDGHLVGDDDDGDAQPAVDVLQQGQDGLGGHGVEGAGGLVAEQHLGVAGEGAGDGDALLLTAGELRGVVVGLVGQSDDLEQLLHALVGLCAGHAGQLEGVAHIAGDGLLHQQIELLKDHGDLLAQLAQLLAVHFEDAFAVDEDIAGGRGFEAVHAADQRGLASAAEADDAEDFALLDLQADVFDGVELLAVGVEGLADIFKLEQTVHSFH